MPRGYTTTAIIGEDIIKLGVGYYGNFLEINDSEDIDLEKYTREELIDMIKQFGED